MFLNRQGGCALYGIAIIDDNKTTADMLAAAIPWDTIGCAVCGVAYDGVQGKRLLEEQHPDIIIADIRMPGMDGLEMVAQVRSILPNSRIIFMSAYDDFAYVQKALHLHAHEYLLKPFENSQLTACVQQLLKEMETESQDADPEFSAYSPVVNHILAYISDHPERHSLQETAEHFGFSASYISMLIKKETGDNYMNWVTRAKIRLAKQLLRDPNYRIEEVAEKVGYKNYISFYTMFVKWSGLSPREYRNGGKKE